MKGIKLWKVQSNDDLNISVDEIENVSETETENQLEEVITRRPELLMKGLKLVGRQTETPGGPLDLLGVDADGRLVIFELKRGTLTREAVAQVIDYSSYLATLEPEELSKHIEERSGNLGIEKIEDFLQWYQEEFGKAFGEYETPAMVLVGLGVAVIFIPTMKILSEWFFAREFAMMTAILIVVGGLGWLSAATPLALLTLWVGWRMGFIIIGIGTLILAILFWFVIRDRPHDMGLPSPTDIDASNSKTDAEQSRIGLLEGMRTVLCQPYFWPVAIWFFFTCGNIFGFGGLWGGPFIMEVYGLSKAEIHLLRG